MIAKKDTKCLYFHLLMMFGGKKTGYRKEVTLAQLLSMHNVNK